MNKRNKPMTEDEVEKCLELNRQGLSNRAVARAVGLNSATVDRLFQRLRVKPTDNTEQPKSLAPTLKAHDDGTVSVEAVSVKCITTEAELLAACAIDIDRWVITDRSHRAWTQLGKDSVIYQMHHVSMRLAPKLDNLYRPANPVAFIASEPRLRTDGVAVFVPDSHNGYQWDGRHRRLRPLHDRRAWDIVVQLCADVQPEAIFLLGDMLDVAALSMKYSRHPTFNQTLQPALDELHWWIARLRSECPSSRIVYQSGNHEDRKDRLAETVAPELVGLCRAQETVPLMSLRNLLRLDELDVETVEDYGDGQWLWAGRAAHPVRVHHGDVAKGGGGATTRAVAARGKFHQVFGHIHRVELATGTTHGPAGAYQLHTLSPGTIARVDGIVPGVTGAPDWQQGVGVMTLVGQNVFPELVHIDQGVAVRGSTVYHGKDWTTRIAADTGWPQMVDG